MGGGVHENVPFSFTEEVEEPGLRSKIKNIKASHGFAKVVGNSRIFSIAMAKWCLQISLSNSNSDHRIWPLVPEFSLSFANAGTFVHETFFFLFPSNSCLIQISSVALTRS